jgi:hypothetical protein
MRVAALLLLEGYQINLEAGLMVSDPSVSSHVFSML